MKTINILAAPLAAVIGGACFLPLNGATVYWTEINFATPRIVMADSNGSTISSLPVAAQSLPQALALSGGTGRVYFTELAFLNAHVNSIGTNLGSPAAVVGLQSCARGTAIDSTNAKIYWTTTNLAAGAGIFRANLDGSSAEEIEFFGPGAAHTPYGIAVDEKNRTVYWADFESGAIEKDSAASMASVVPVVSGLSGPVGVVLDPDSGFIFWTDANSGDIGRARLDGSGRTNVVTGCQTPQYIAMDRFSRRLYWTEFGSARIRCANTDGSDTLTLASTANPPCGIAVAPGGGIPVATMHPADAHMPAAYAVSIANATSAFAGGIHITYRLPKPSLVVIQVFDLLGRRVATFDPLLQPAGQYRMDMPIPHLAAGAYCMGFDAGQFTTTVKFTAAR